MKRILKVLSYFALPVLGLIWAIGCTKTPSGPGNNGTPPPVDEYVLEISVVPAVVTSESGTGIIHGSLKKNNIPMQNAQLDFRSVASEISSANMTTGSWTDTTSESGFNPTVFYHPVDYEGDIDTIYAVYYAAYGGDTLAWNFVSVEIHHPLIEIDLSIDPISVYEDSSGLISCFLTIDGVPLVNEEIDFRAASSNYSNSIIDPLNSFSDSTTATGTVMPVLYYPNDYEGDIDTLFALYEDDGDTVALSSITVNIIHP